MSDQQVEVYEDDDGLGTETDEFEEAVIEGGTDQGPYTGQSMDIPEVPFNPAAGMTPTEVNEQIAVNQNDQAAAQARGGRRRDDDEVDYEVDDEE
jgi:hypothetical protein